MVSNDEKWYARFQTDGKLYRLERSSLDDSFLEDLMNKCRNKTGTFWSPCGRPHKTAEVAWAGVPLLNGFVGVW